MVPSVMLWSRLICQPFFDDEAAIVLVDAWAVNWANSQWWWPLYDRVIEGELKSSHPRNHLGTEKACQGPTR